MKGNKVTIDANEAAAYIAYLTNEVIAIYPITPSSTMGEWADQWASEQKPNAWGTIPRVIEMQSEGGAAGAIHGALQTGALATTFTASQGLLLMIPNMYKIAGELTPAVFHVAARSLATQALSIFGDHSDVMAARATGFAMLASNSVQEAMDFALIAQAATLESRVPFLHFFDGFRTSHEIQKIEQISLDDIRSLIKPALIQAHRARALSPDHPFIRGTAQNPDVHFQARETVNPFYLACPTIVQNVMDLFTQRTGRSYRLFDYFGAADADRVIILMGSGAEAAQELVESQMGQGEKIGLLKVRLYRPFDVMRFVSALPATVRAIAVLDRTKEPGSSGEPLYLDVVASVSEALALNAAPFLTFPRIIGGRYGLGLLSKTEAVAAIKRSIEKTYGSRGTNLVEKNFLAVDSALENLHEVNVPEAITSRTVLRTPVAEGAPEFVRKFTAEIIASRGDQLPVSAFPVDGTYPTGTAQWEKRNITQQIPVWDEDICIQCGKCVLVCPHATIRAKVVPPATLSDSPPEFKSAPARWREFGDWKYTLQVAPEDCTGCTLCVEICPAKSKTEVKHKAINMEAQAPIRDRERANWEYFLKLPDMNRQVLSQGHVKDVQLLEPLFEFSGACAGCGETPYLKLVSQLFGDRALIANATGCSSIYGGNLPTTPWTKNREGLGPAWSNSLFEDNAEFGLGMRLALNKQAEYAAELVQKLAGSIGEELAAEILDADQTTETNIHLQRERVKALKRKLQTLNSKESNDLLAVVDTLVKKSVWIIGGDGWAYDIGYGGLDHVIASGENVNLLVLDTEVYSNTGGQSSKATPRAAVAKFASSGKTSPKKDLALMAINYDNVYVARIAMGGNDTHTIKTLLEAEAFDGPSLIIAYSHCIAHGYDMARGMDQQKAAVLTGYWPLFRYNPALLREGKNPMQLDSKPPSLPLEKYVYDETRYSMLKHSNPGAAADLLKLAQQDVMERWKIYEYLAAMKRNGQPQQAEPV